MKPTRDFNKAKNGAVVPIPKGKTKITMHIDDDVLEWFREKADHACAGNYETLMNEALHQYIRDGGEPFEAILRRVVREELNHAN